MNDLEEQAELKLREQWPNMPVDSSDIALLADFARAEIEKHASWEQPWKDLAHIAHDLLKIGEPGLAEALDKAKRQMFERTRERAAIAVTKSWKERHANANWDLGAAIAAIGTLPYEDD